MQSSKAGMSCERSHGMPSELSEEDALAEGAEIISRRKERQEMEARLRKRMGHSMVNEWMFWLGVALSVLYIYSGSLSAALPFDILKWMLPVFLIFSGMESAAMKREQALLDWIEYQKTKDKPHN